MRTSMKMFATLLLLVKCLMANDMGGPIIRTNTEELTPTPEEKDTFMNKDTSEVPKKAIRKAPFEGKPNIDESSASKKMKQAYYITSSTIVCNQQYDKHCF
ncbi:hypothetical protein Tco_0169786 [Tanacetum coccineum]